MPVYLQEVQRRGAGEAGLCHLLQSCLTPSLAGRPAPWVNAAGPSATHLRPPCPHLWDGVPSRRHREEAGSTFSSGRGLQSQGTNYPVIANKCFWKFSFCTGQESDIAS